MSSEPFVYYKTIRRIRQACHNCRRKKARCPGQRPECSFCARLGQACSYSDDESLSPRQQAAYSVSAGQRHKDRARRLGGAMALNAQGASPASQALAPIAASDRAFETASAAASTVMPASGTASEPASVPATGPATASATVSAPAPFVTPDLTGRIRSMEIQLADLTNSVKNLESTLATLACAVTKTISVHAARSNMASDVDMPLQNSLGFGSADGVPVDGNTDTTDSISTLPYSRLPPPNVVHAAADLYFRYCHNQPYSLFHEASFRNKIKAQEVPAHLLFALVASTVRYSDDPFLARREAATTAYAQQSWRAIVVPWNGLQSDAELSIVQTILLLAIIDYTEGRTQASWIKVGLAIRLCQDFRLMVEPDASLPPAHQEERRRVFWSFYLCDKLISCGRERPATILDDHCRLRLPCDENMWRSDALPDNEFRPPTLSELTADVDGGGVGGGRIDHRRGSRSSRSPGWSNAETVKAAAAGNMELSQLSPFAVTVLITSLLGRCAQYALGEQEEQTNGGNLPPWSPRSKYSALHSAVLQLESELGLNEPLPPKIARCCLTTPSSSGSSSGGSSVGSNEETVIDPHRAAPLAFSHAIFHLCQCLLYHPFLLWRRLAGVSQRTPQSFVLHTLSACHNAASALSQLMGDIRSLQTSLLTTNYDPFYGYCNMVAGVVHVLFLEAADPSVRQAATAGYAASLENLQNLSVYWKSCARMRARLADFNTASQAAVSDGRPRFSHIVDPVAIQQQQVRLDPTDANDLLECLDYARMSTTTRRRTQPANSGNSSGDGSSSNGVGYGIGGGFGSGFASGLGNGNSSSIGRGAGAGDGNNRSGCAYAFGDSLAHGNSSRRGSVYLGGGSAGGNATSGGRGGDDNSSGGTGLTPLSQIPSPFFEELVNLLPFTSSRPITPRRFDAMFDQPPTANNAEGVSSAGIGGLNQVQSQCPGHGHSQGHGHSHGHDTAVSTPSPGSMHIACGHHSCLPPFETAKAGGFGSSSLMDSSAGRIFGFP